MKVNLLNSKEWENLRDNIKIFYSEKNSNTVFYGNIKNSIREAIEEKIITGEFGKILTVAPFTYTKEFESESEAFEDLCIYKALREYFKSKGIDREQEFQYPHFLMGYLSLDNITWHNIVQFQKIMKGKTNEICYKGCLINSKKYIDTLDESEKQIILQRSNQIGNELKKNNKLSENIKLEIQKILGKSNYTLSM